MTAQDEPGAKENGHCRMAQNLGAIQEERSLPIPDIVRLLNRRVLPLLCLGALLNLLVRTNVAFASKSLSQDINLKPASYGLATGMYSLTYALAQLPCNAALLALGAPNWLTIISAAWALCSAAVALVHNAGQLTAVQAALGLAQAGFLPAAWYYTATLWPRDQLALPFTFIQASVSASQVLAAPLASALLSLDGARGLAGWQWLVLIEAIPSFLIAGAFKAFLPASIAACPFLTAHERAKLAAHRQQLATASRLVEPGASDPFWRVTRRVLSNPYFYYVSLANLSWFMSVYTLLYWSPPIVAYLFSGEVTFAGAAGLARGLPPPSPFASGSPQAPNVSLVPSGGDRVDTQGVLLAGVPFVLAVVACVAIGSSSTRRQERHLHAAVPFIATGLYTCCFPLLRRLHVGLAFLAIILQVGFGQGAYGLLVALLSDACPGKDAAVGLPLFSTIGFVGGFLGPYAIGLLVGRQGNYDAAVVMVGAFLMLTGLQVLLLKWWQPPRPRVHSAVDLQALGSNGLDGGDKVDSPAAKGELLGNQVEQQTVQGAATLDVESLVLSEGNGWKVQSDGRVASGDDTAAGHVAKPAAAPTRL